MRGEIWTVAGGGDFIGMPRPAVIIEADGFDDMGSVTLCPMTTNPAEALLFRVPVEPNDRNGLDEPSRIMADKVTTVRRSRLGTVMGRLDDEDMVRLTRAVSAFLGLAD